MATTTADERSGWGFWRILGLFVLIVLAVLVALYFYNPTELKRVGNDAMDHARSYKRTIVSDYDRFYQCMRGGGATTVAAVQQVDRPSARPRGLEGGPIVVYPPYPEYPVYPTYPEMPAGGGQDMPAGQTMPPGADAGGMSPQAAPGMQNYPGYPRAPDYPQPPIGPQGPSGAMYPGPAGTMEPGPQGAMPSRGRFQGPGGYDMPPPWMQQRPPGMPGMRMPGPPGGRTWQAQPTPPGYGPGPGGQIMAQPGPGMRPSMGMPARPMPAPQPGPYYERPMGGEGSGGGAVPGGMTSPTGFGPQPGPPAAWMAGAQSAAPMPPMREMPVPAQREPVPILPTREPGMVPPQDMGQAAAPAAPPPVGMIVIPGPSSTAPVPHSVPPAAQAAAPMPQAATQPPAFAPAPVVEVQSMAQPGQPAWAAAARLAPAAPAMAQASQPPQAAYGPSEPPLDPQIVAARHAFGRQQIQDSIRTYREYINTHHDSAMAFGELGNVLLVAGRPQEAAQAYYEASARLIDMGQPGNVYLLLPLIEQHDPLLAAVITRRLAALPRSYY